LRRRVHCDNGSTVAGTGVTCLKFPQTSGLSFRPSG
jgi:hypothetical protein